MFKAVDLFSGAGGFSTGFEKSNFIVTKAVEFDNEIANTYKFNHPNTKMIVDDIKNVDQTDEFKYGEADVIIGGPPCQGFSMAGARNRDGFMGDPRNYLFKHYFNIVKKVKPKAFVIENVKGLLSMEKGAIFNEIMRIFSDKRLLDGDSYSLFWKVAKTVEFGIPQKRERLIIIGVLNGDDIDFDDIYEYTINDIKSKIPNFFDKVVLKEAIGNLPSPSDSGEVSNPNYRTSYEEYLSSSKKVITNHQKRNHSLKTIERMSKIKVGQNFESLNDNIKSVHSGSYGRMSWNEPSMTITTRFDTPSGGRFTLPDKNRTLTAREAARIQSFPDDYVFLGSKSSINKQIGNAVPPKLAYFLAEFLNNILFREK